MKVLFRLEARVRSTQFRADWDDDLQQNGPIPLDDNISIIDDNEIKHYDAYILDLYGAITVSKSTHYYTFFQKFSIFEFIDYCHFIIPSYEIFLNYRVMRKEKEYFLDSTLDTISQELIDGYIEKIEEWLVQNACKVTEEPFEIADFNHDNMIENEAGKKLSLNEKENIRSFDKYCVSFGFSRNIYWDTGWPTYEGDGNGTIITIASFIILLYSKYDPIRSKVEKAKIKSYGEKILKQYKPSGILTYPCTDSYDVSLKYKRIYTFVERNSAESPMTYYHVCIPRTKSRIRIKKVPVVIESSQREGYFEHT